MSRATPMDGMTRADVYGRRSWTWTPRQLRRFAHKHHADLGRQLAALQQSDPEIELCHHHIRKYCPGCLACRTCDGCICP